MSLTPSSSGRSPGGSPNGHAAVIQPLEIPNGASVDSPGSQIRGSTGSPETLQPVNTRGSEPYVMDMLFAGWDPDLPDPEVLKH